MVKIFKIIAIVSLIIINTEAFAEKRLNYSYSKIAKVINDENYFSKNRDLKQYSECLDKANGVTSNIMDCSGDEITKQDDRLNENYNKLLNKLPAAEKLQLKKTQRSWIKNRDHICDKISRENEGGSLAEVQYNDCILIMTVERNSELKDLLEKN